ncbi:MAG: alkaline phosphatase family protein [Candidatus Spyradocola sp.]|jgi:phosphonoacetate hydrolase
MPIFFLVLDGCAPEYFTAETAPRLHRLAGAHGFVKRVQCAMPSVTNVNHACLLSGKWPEETGIVGNYVYDPRTGREGFLEERGHMRAPTLLQWARRAGGKTALLTVKGKILGVYGEGADIGLSAERPDPALLERLSLTPPPDIRSVDSTRWILEAAYRCMEAERPDFLYCTTNDCIFHHFAPGAAEAREQIAAVDEWVTRLHDETPDLSIYITADHGMNQKTRLLNFQAVAERAGFALYCLPPLKDRYIENHVYQEGGTLYVFLKDAARAAEFVDFARSQPEVEQVLTAAQAAAVYHLPEAAIGDYVLLSAPGCAFAELPCERLYTDASRTHGSLYEREIPLLAIHPAAGAEAYRFSKDVAAILMGERMDS